MNNSIFKPHYHAELAKHYTQRMADPTIPADQLPFLTHLRDYHQREAARFDEILAIAQEIRVAFSDMLQLGRMVARQMETDEDCQLDAKPHRVMFTAGDGQILAWIKTISQPVNATV